MLFCDTSKRDGKRMLNAPGRQSQPLSPEANFRGWRAGDIVYYPGKHDVPRPFLSSHQCGEDKGALGANGCCGRPSGKPHRHLFSRIRVLEISLTWIKYI